MRGGGFITTDLYDGTKNHFFIFDIRNNYYCLSNMCVWMHEEPKSADADPEDYPIQLPLQYINDRRMLPYHLPEHDSDPDIADGTPTIFFHTTYETTAPIDDWAEFYLQSGWYDVEIIGNELHIKKYLKDPTNDISESAGKDNQVFPIIFQFLEQDSKIFFQILN